MNNAVLGGAEASFAIARVALLRAMRGRALWVVAGLALIPLGYAGLAHAGDQTPGDAWRYIVEIWMYLVAILVPVLLAGSIGEEIEERTASYLWSRPLPRWSIIGGKLVALVPVLWVIMAASLLITCALYPNGLDDPARVVLSVLLGILAAAAVTACISAFAPKYGTLLGLAYLVLLDRNLAWFSASVGKISIAFHVLNLAGVHPANEPMVESIAWLCGLSLVWVALAALRVRRME